MFCTNCGKKIDDGAKFCSACGTKMIQTPVEAPKVEEKPVAGPRVEEKPAAAPTKVEPPKPAPVEKPTPAPAAEPVKAKTKKKNLQKQRKLKRLNVLQVVLSILAVVAVIAVILLLVFGKLGEKAPEEDTQESAQVQEAEENVSDDAPAEEAQEVPEEETPVGTETPEQLRSKLYGTWGVYYGEILQTITIDETGSIYLWDGSNEQFIEYTWVNDTTIKIDNLEYAYTDGVLKLYQDGVDTGYAYKRCPPLAGTPTTGKASYEELYALLTQKYMFTSEHVDCMPSYAKAAIGSALVWRDYGIDGWDAMGEVIKISSLPSRDLAQQMNQYYFEEGGISYIKFNITDLIPSNYPIDVCRQQTENYNAATSEPCEQYAWEIAKAEGCWMAVGDVIYKNGKSIPLSTDESYEGPLYILLIDGRYYWLWTELG